MKKRMIIMAFACLVVGGVCSASSADAPSEWKWRSIPGEGNALANEESGYQVYIKGELESDDSGLLERARIMRRNDGLTVLASLGALFWNNVHRAARREGGYKKLFTLKGAKALVAVTLRNFLGLKQGDDDTLLRRLGRFGLNWVSLFMVLMGYDAGGIREFTAVMNYKKALREGKDEETAQRLKQSLHHYKWKRSWETLGL